MFKELIILCVISTGCVLTTVKGEDGDDNNTLTIRSYFINSVVQNHFATVRYKIHVVNKHDEAVNSTFVVPTPERTFISNFSLFIDNMEYVGETVLNANISGDSGTINQTELAARVQVRGRKSMKPTDRNIFEIDVTLAAGKEATIIVTYYERLIRKNSYYKQRLIVEPGQVVESLLVNAIFVEDQGFETFSYLLPNSTKYHDSSSDLASLIQSPTKRSLLYERSRDQQLSYSSHGIVGELTMVYKLKSTQGAGLVNVQEYYFVHYFTPSGLKPIDKNIIFVLDRSGSMDGTKIRQLRESMLTILDNLNPRDNFNILTFASTTATLFNRPVEANQQNIEEAKDLVIKTLNAGGGTRINSALLEAIKSLKDLPDNSSRAQVILFLTDGQASEGETDNEKILKNVRNANDGSISIYCLGFGSNADRQFLKDIATQNRGLFAGIPENAEAKEELIKAYLQIKDPLLLDVSINYDSMYVKLNSTSNNKFSQYFNGTEIIVTGSLQRSGFLPPEAVLVSGISRDGNLNFTMNKEAVVVRPKDTEKIDNEIYDESVMIQDQLELYALNRDNIHKDNIEKIALKHNLVTPFTSYVLEVTAINSKNGATHHNCLGVSAKASFLFCAFSIILFYN